MHQRVAFLEVNQGSPWCICRKCRKSRPHHADLSSLEIKARIGRLHSHGITRVIFAHTALFHTNHADFLEWCRELKIEPVLWIEANSISDDIDKVQRWIASECEIELLFSNQPDSVAFSRIQELIRHTQRTPTCVWMSRPKSGLKANLRLARALKIKKVSIYSPPPDRETESFLSTDEVYLQVEEARAQFPEIEIVPHPCFSFRVSTENFDHFYPECLQSLRFGNVLSSRPACSVIIPAYNRVTELEHSLRSLLSASSEFNQPVEIIVVDDGSTDNPDEMIDRAAAQHFSSYPSAQISVQLIVLNRKDPHRPGDHYYRAGIARNLGARHASSEILVFIDSDVLVPKNFFLDLHSCHAHSDLVQYPRLSTRIVNGAPVALRAQDSYWQSFYSRAHQHEWIQLSTHWLYLSTTCLSVKKDLFESVGGFSAAFDSYGFEDTLLGWQISQKSKRWHLSQEPVFHIEEQRAFSEHRRNAWSKAVTLSRSAKSFYHLTLDSDFYRIFYPLLGAPIALRLLLHRLMKLSVHLLQRFSAASAARKEV